MIVADFMCVECGIVHENLAVDTKRVKCCRTEPNENPEFELSIVNRIWATPNIGSGSSGGTPPR